MITRTDRRTSLIATWVLALSIAGYPVVGLISTILGIGDSSLSIVFRLLVIGLCAATLPSILRRIAPDRWIYGLLVIMMMYLVRLLYDHYFLGIDDTLEHLAFFVATALIPALAVAHAPPVEEKPLAAALLLLGTTFVALAFLIQIGVLSGGAPVASFTVEGRFQLTKLNPISIGQASVELMIAAFAYHKIKASPRENVVLLLLLLAGFYMLAAAGSRSPLLGFALVILVLVVRERAPVNHFVIIFGVALAAVSVDWGTVIERFSSAAERTDISSEERIRLAMSVLERPAEWLIAGAFHIDPSAGEGEYVHNFTLDSMLSLGILGAIWFHVTIGKSLLAAAGEDRDSPAILLLLLVLSLVHAAFSGALYSNSGLWVLMVAILRRHQYKSELQVRTNAWRQPHGMEWGEA